MTSPQSSRTSHIARNALLAVWALLLLALVVEVAARAYWFTRFGIGPLDTRAPATAFYPELLPILASQPSSRDPIIDVLLLGASVLSEDFGSVPQALREELALATRREVRVWSPGQKAQGALDSLYQYRGLAGVGFDAVVIYHGLNELRANNVPPELFHSDFSHYAYYETLRDVLGDGRLWPFAAPYTLEYWLRARREASAARAGHPIRVPRHDPRASWTAYGAEIRSAGPFRKNVEAILDLAAERREPALLLTVATYVAPGYSRDAFDARRLDYATHYTPIELWGVAEHVAKGVAAHNAEIRALVAARPGLAFFDLDAALPKERRYWNDVTHFTVAGSQRVAELVLPHLLGALPAPLQRPIDPGAGAAAPGAARAQNE